MKTKQEWINELELEPHVEGGYFRQTYKAVETVELNDKRIRAYPLPSYSYYRAIIPLTFIYSHPMKFGTIILAML